MTCIKLTHRTNFGLLLSLRVMKHSDNSCRYMNVKCLHCNRKGPIKRGCRSRQFKESPGENKRHVRNLALPRSNLQNVKAAAEVRSKPIMVEVAINDLPVNMELDTGAAVSVTSISQFHLLFPNAQFRRASRTLRTYTNEPVQPCGAPFVAAQCNAQSLHLPLYVLHQDGQPLLGRNWLQHVQLNWTQIHGLHHIQHGRTSSSKKSPEFESLLSRYQELFKDELGTVKDFPGAGPCFTFCAHPHLSYRGFVRRRCPRPSRASQPHVWSPLFSILPVCTARRTPHRFRATSPADLQPFPSPFKSSLLMNYSFSGHASSTRCPMPHAQLFFAPQLRMLQA
nr:uncharacterized protein LOC129388058 [Dermacentor andersoni]